ncbi:putative membrane-bound lytic murein transglycosylase [Taylorella equigenitalis 14/56]|uniref:Putative membrane-bound lytic murein transglycosylase n=1 Tax=Taylorella equigenitalis 14/56 TaxID=1091497 RepID=I7IXL9_9BURK|nr:lytic murein transglycosylase [Taylorella equigenitalis]CCG17324.1 putative membrane-bound lytic murein transglycosylase [Taylorella equigenitalis 14/56]
MTMNLNLKSIVIATLGISFSSSIYAMTDSFQNCLSLLRGPAEKSNVNYITFEKYVLPIKADDSLLQKLNYQPEFVTPIWRYMANLVDQERINQGRALMQKHASLLEKVQNQMGVDPATVVAIWGVESNFGTNLGKYDLVRSLGTLACKGRRKLYFRGELFSALRILQSGDITKDKLKGSWAGAFGQTQFMPSTFERIAVDFDHDGRRDLVDNVADALGSTANYMVKSGWQTGKPWGAEVALPPNMSIEVSGRKNKRPLHYWMSKGIKTIDGQNLSTLASPDTRAALLLPAGIDGPAFITFKNFDAIYSYNAAESYALAIAHLSDRLRGKGPIVKPWPTKDVSLSRAQIRELQTILISRGHQIGEPDGIAGSKTQDAIRFEQQRLSLPATGIPEQSILERLKSEKF